MSNDRLDPELLEGTKLPKPEVEIIVAGEKVLKPGMKTFFVRLDEESGVENKVKTEVVTGKTVYGTVCTCDMVCTCENVCSCVGYVPPCTCNLVCSCDNHQICTCDAVCSCESYTVCPCNSQGFSYCSCNIICPCAPVH